MKENAKIMKPDIPFYSVVSGGVDSSLVSKYLKNESKSEPKYICLKFGEKDKSHLMFFIRKISRK